MPVESAGEGGAIAGTKVVGLDAEPASDAPSAASDQAPYDCNEYPDKPVACTPPPLGLRYNSLPEGYVYRRHDTKSNYFISSLDDPWNEVAERFQTFYRNLEDDLRSGGSSPSILRKRDKDERRSEEEQDQARAEKVKHDEEKIREILEKVERTLCTVFYDRYRNIRGTNITILICPSS